jgi:dTDP-glucose pyrophosphorylase
MGMTDTMSDLQIIIPMAGSGVRFKNAGYTNPKPLIDVAGKPMIQRAVETLGLDGSYIFITSEYEDFKHNVRIHELLRSMYTGCTIIQLFGKTDGPVITCMHAKKYLDPEKPLLITNCDQVLMWDREAFITHAMTCDMDGLVVTYEADTPKNSYIELDENGLGVRVAEKEVISNHSLNGVHFWKKARYFLESAQMMVNANVRVNGEFYIAPTFNEMIGSGLRVGAYPIPREQHHAVGTPDDLHVFLKALETDENLKIE